MPKFILIDHSIKGWGGHYLEYARCVLEAAAEKGFRPFLVTNRSFRPHPDLSLPYSVLPLYPLDVWGRGGSPSLQRPALQNLPQKVLKRWGERFSFTLLHLLEEGAGDPERLLRSPILRHHPLGPLLVRLFARRRKGKRPIASSLSPGNPSPSSPPGTERQSKQALAFLAATRTLFQNHLLLEEEDLVFIPTLSEADLKGLAEYLLSHPESRKASWHLVFRRNIFSGWEKDYHLQLKQVESLRQTLKSIKEKLPHHRIHFYTDTERLSKQYEFLGEGAFRTLPIPVDRRLEPNRKTSTGKPLRIAYLGDARLEKGFSLIPDLILDLWDDYVATGRVEFLIQCNLAFDPREQPGVVVALSQLELLEGRGVRLIREPLNQERYLELLLSTDINLLLYDQERYYARSSGILVESLSAGIPVLVSGGTWLADQITAAQQLHHRDLCRRMTAEILCSGEKAGTVAVPAAPEKAEFLLFSLCPARQEEDFLFRLIVRQRNEHGLSLTRQTFLFHSAEEEGTALLRLLPDAREVEFILSSPHPLGLDDIRIHALKPHPGVIHPLGVVGLVVGEPEEASLLLRELIEHHAHYRRTAEEFSLAWRERHNAGRLVEKLAGAERGGIHLEERIPIAEAIRL